MPLCVVSAFFHRFYAGFDASSFAFAEAVSIAPATEVGIKLGVPGLGEISTQAVPMLFALQAGSPNRFLLGLDTLTLTKTFTKGDSQSTAINQQTTCACD